MNKQGMRGEEIKLLYRRKKGRVRDQIHLIDGSI